MKHLNVALCLLFFGFSSGSGGDPVDFNTQWIPQKPEVNTYQSKDQNGSGLYQVSLSKKDSVFEVYTNIIYPGFAKTVSGIFNKDMQPLRSQSKIIVNGQIMMDTECEYKNNSLSISTKMSPYNQTMDQNLSYEHTIIDFSQIPILCRTLNFNNKSQYTFTSVNPQKNILMDLTLSVIGQEKVNQSLCHKVEVHDFEGKAIYWVETEGEHRILKVEQPEQQRITTLLY